MKKSILKKLVWTALAGALIIAGAIAFVYMQPHRDVQNTKTDYSFKASDIVTEYLTDASAANEKYLDEEGESKVLEIEGKIAAITKDYQDKTVITLKNESDKAGVDCTLIDNTSTPRTETIVKVKGVIRSGAAYDDDLEMYENVIMEKCQIIN